MRIGDYALEQAARRRFQPAQRALLQPVGHRPYLGWRVPAPELERVVLTAARSIMANQAAQAGCAGRIQAPGSVAATRTVAGKL
jgi:hypothetical protein